MNKIKNMDLAEFVVYSFIVWLFIWAITTALFGIGASIIYFIGSTLAWTNGLFIAYILHIKGELDE